MITTEYDMQLVIDLMSNGVLQNEDAKKAIRQAHYNQRCKSVIEINQMSLDEGFPASSQLSLPDAPEPFPIDFSRFELDYCF